MVDIDVLDIHHAAACCGLSLTAFRWRVYVREPEEARWKPSGYLGEKPYWSREDLDAYMSSWQDRRKK